MSDVLICTLPATDTHWRPELFPGSKESRAAGCTCPEAQPWPGQFAFATDCAIHEMEQAT